MNAKSLEPAKLTSKDIWQKTLDTLRKSWRQTVALGVLGILLPEVILDLFLDVRGSQAAAQFRELASSQDALGVLDLLEPIRHFAPELLLGSLAVSALAVGAYLALVELALGTLRGVETRSVPRLLGRGIKTALLRFPGAIFALLVITAMAQVLIAPAILIAILCLVAPVICVSEQKGAIRSAFEAITVRYAQGTKFGRWSIMFNLLSIGATFYLLFIVVALGAEQLLTLDQHLPALRSAWAQTIAGLPFGPVYILASLSESVLLLAVLTVAPFVTSSLYFLVAGRREIGRA